MRIQSWAAMAVVVTGLAAAGGMALAAQDRFTLKVPDGLSFSEFKGYQTWQGVASSATKDQIKMIVGNPAMIAAYKDGLPAKGKVFPDGVKIVKIEWATKTNTAAPYAVQVPGDLQAIAIILKDTKRFPKTHGWAYAVFDYDAATKTFKPDGKGAECGYECHSKVAADDYIYTHYPVR
jgi:Cytochrome P460